MEGVPIVRIYRRTEGIQTPSLDRAHVRGEGPPPTETYVRAVAGSSPALNKQPLEAPAAVDERRELFFVWAMENGRIKNSPMTDSERGGGRACLH